MWLNDEVKIIKYVIGKRNKKKRKVIGKGVIIDHIGEYGFSDEFSIFDVKKENGDIVTVDEEDLELIV